MFKFTSKRVRPIHKVCLTEVQALEDGHTGIVAYDKLIFLFRGATITTI
jgi:hypothetical protein